MTSTTPDPWPAIEELAGLLNDLADTVVAHTKQLRQPSPAKPKTQARTPDSVPADDLRAWVDALVDEYGLHAQIGPPSRWQAIPPLRAELLGLMIADVRRLELEQGSFELVYWHDALARVVGRAGEHADRWQQDQQNQRLLGAHE